MPNDSLKEIEVETKSGVLYHECWDVTQHFPDGDVCEMEYTLTIRKIQEEYELRIIEHYVGLPEGVGDMCQMPSPYPTLYECVEDALERMHDAKLGVGMFNLGAGVPSEEVIRQFTGFTWEEARRISWDEIDPMVDNEVLTELCNSQCPDQNAWNRLVERVNRNVAYDLCQERRRDLGDRN